MRYSILAFAAGAAAAPFAATGGAALCPTGLYSNPQCCATDVLNAAALNCAVRTLTPFPPLVLSPLLPSPHLLFDTTILTQTAATLPASTNEFISTCAATGQQAKCCVVPVANQAVLCQDVSPSASGGGSPTPAPTPSSAPPAPTGGASSSSCESSAPVTTATPTKPAPTPSAPAATSDCGCDD
jgi:hypothetical protein